MSAVAIRAITGHTSEKSLFEYVDASSATMKSAARAMECLTSSSSSSSSSTGGSGGGGGANEVATKKRRGPGGMSINISFDHADIAGGVRISTNVADDMPEYSQ